ncbi:MAG: hypothetical protein Kow0042_14430 [Calditrichia bacterium]
MFRWVINKTGFLIGVCFLFSVVHFNFAKEQPDFRLSQIPVEVANSKHWQIVEGPFSLGQMRTYSQNEEYFDYLNAFQIEDGLQFRLLRVRDSIAMQVEIFQARSQIMAFGLYAIEKSPSLKFFDLGFESYLSGNRLFCWYGIFMVTVHTPDSLIDIENSLKNCGKFLLDLLPEQKRHTPILDALPEKDRVEHSDKFYHQHWLDQSYFKNIYYADYYTPEGYSRIFIIDNITTASADSNFWKYHHFIKSNAELIEEELQLGTDFFIVLEPLWGKTVLAKKNQIIYGILDYRNKDWAEDRLAELLSRLKKKKIVKPG